MTTTGKIRLAALVAIANGALALTFASPPCEAGFNCKKVGACIHGVGACQAPQDPNTWCAGVCSGEYQTLKQKNQSSCKNTVWQGGGECVPPGAECLANGGIWEVRCPCWPCYNPPCQEF